MSFALKDGSGTLERILICPTAVTAGAPAVQQVIEEETRCQMSAYGEQLREGLQTGLPNPYVGDIRGRVFLDCRTGAGQRNQTTL